MSATIPSTKLVSDLLKSTGFDCPEDLKGKTFEEATSGGGGSGEDNIPVYTTVRAQACAKEVDGTAQVSIDPTGRHTVRFFYSEGNLELLRIVYDKVSGSTTYEGLLKNQSTYEDKTTGSGSYTLKFEKSVSTSDGKTIIVKATTTAFGYGTPGSLVLLAEAKES